MRAEDERAVAAWVDRETVDLPAVFMGSPAAANLSGAEVRMLVERAFEAGIRHGRSEP